MAKFCENCMCFFHELHDFAFFRKTTLDLASDLLYNFDKKIVRRNGYEYERQITHGRIVSSDG